MTTTSEQVTVTQADRDAAASIVKIIAAQIDAHLGNGRNIVTIEYNNTDGPLVQAFARHRTQSHPSSDASSAELAAARYAARSWQQAAEQAWDRDALAQPTDTREAVIEECARVAETIPFGEARYSIGRYDAARDIRKLAALDAPHTGEVLGG